MKKYITLLSLLFISLFNVTPINAQEKNERTTSVYFIRHAEKDRSNPDERNPHLTDQGIQRAEKWAHFFKDIPLDAVYSTNYHRTIETAYPTAQQKGLEVINYDPRILDPSPFVNKHKGRTILIVGHSNTTPQFANDILGEEKYPEINDDNNGNLYIVTIQNKNKSSILLKIN